MNKQATTELFELVDKRKYTNADFEKIKSLLSEGADPNFRQKEYPNETVLHRIISSWENKNRLEIVKLLFEFGVNFNLTSDIFYPIDKAVIEGDIDLVQFMLENGVNQGLDYALKSAIERDNIDLATLLISFGINVNVAVPYAKSYLIFCCEAYRIRDRNTKYQTQPGIKMAQLLVNQGIDVNGIANDSTPILEAIAHNFYELIDLLVDYGAVIRDEINVPLWVNTVQMFQFLVNKGIIKNLNKIMLPTEQTPLIYHSAQSNFEIVKYLIQNGANLYHADKHKKTAFHYALYTENLAFIDYLLDHYDVKKCHEISSVFNEIDDKKTINKLKTILDTII
nr:ankyrin repeat domain-containing protein [uncultured Flavobacterium sp.]